MLDYRRCLLLRLSPRKSSLALQCKADEQITLPTRAYSLKRTGGPKPAAEEPTDEKLADGDEEPDSPTAATTTLDDQSLRGRQPKSGEVGRDASTPSERTIVDPTQSSK
jgi:hypothetical protein